MKIKKPKTNFKNLIQRRSSMKKSNLIGTIVLIFSIILILNSCGNKSYKQSDAINFEYQKSDLQISIDTSDIMASDYWLSGNPGGRLTIDFKIKNNSDKTVKIHPSDFKVFLPEEEKNYTGELLRSLDDFTDEEYELLYDEQQYIVFPEMEANFSFIYFLPYAISKEYYDETIWGLYSKGDYNFKVLLDPSYGNNITK